jgi:hypothetical protein
MILPPLPTTKGGVSMPGWTTAPVNGVWRMENADYHGHRLSIRRTGLGTYRAHLDGHPLGLWRSKYAAMAAAEWAAVAQDSRREPAPSVSKSGANVIPLTKAKAS